MRKFTTVFHISQTEPASERHERKLNDLPPIETSLIETPRTSPNVAKLTRYADALTPKINHAMRPMTQKNPTPKRNSQFASRKSMTGGICHELSEPSAP